MEDLFAPLRSRFLKGRRGRSASYRTFDRVAFLSSFIWWALSARKRNCKISFERGPIDKITPTFHLFRPKWLDTGRS